MESRGHFLTPDRTAQSDSFSYTISPVQTLTSELKPSTKPSPSQLSSSKLLKDLSLRVQGYLKESHKSVQFHEHKEDILVLKKSNVDMQTVIDQFRGRTFSFQTENTSKTNPHPQRKIEDSSCKIIENSSIKIEPPSESRQQTLKQESQTPSSATLKRHFMTAIQLAIQANDQKMYKQQKYISELERRVARLQQFQRKVDVLKFQREVKLQASPKKAKNYSMRTAPINGDDAYDQPVITPKEGQGGKEKRFFVNPYKKGSNNTNPNGQGQIYQQYTQLQQKYILLQQRYQIQNEARAEQMAQRQNLERKLIQLQQENKILVASATSLEGRLQFHQQKYADLQLFLHAYKSRISGKIHPNLPPSLTTELTAIKNELRLCGVDRYHPAERQLVDEMIGRQLLRSEVAYLQRRITQGCKFSCTHKEVFQLRDKLAACEQQSKKYLQQLQEIRNGSNPLPSQVKAVGQSPSYLQWGRLVYFCVSTAVARLQALLKQPKQLRSGG